MSKSTNYDRLPFLLPSVQLETPKVLKALVRSSRELGELRGFSHIPPNPLLLLSPAVMKESLASSGIEGINTTIIDVLENQLFPEEERSQANKEVIRYTEALFSGTHQLNNLSLSTRLIHGVQHELMPDSPDGYRKQQNAIARQSDGKIIHLPPRASDIALYMENLENYMNGVIAPEHDPILRTVISHYQFEAIHPFPDGNGRTGRILMVLQLMKFRVLSYPILFISGYLKNNQFKYYEMLENVTSHSNWEDYVLFMLEGLEIQAKITKKLISSILTLQDETKAKIILHNRKLFSSELVNQIFTYPVITPAKAARELGIHYITATKYLNELEKIGILTRKKVGKYAFYLNHQLIAILHN